jgi:hypothetical protein
MVDGVGASCTLAASLSVTVFTDQRSLPHADTNEDESAKHAASSQTLIRRKRELVMGVIATSLSGAVQHTRVKLSDSLRIACRGIP